MKFFQGVRHDRQQNIIRRTPPPRIVKLFKNAWLPENYENIFEKIHHQSGESERANANTADVEHSPIMPSPSSSATADWENAASNILKLKYELPLKKIDPCVVSEALATAPKVEKKAVINLINHLHFIKEQVAIHIKDRTTGEEFLKQGEPGPYLDGKVTIRFADHGVFNISRHVPLNLVIDNRKSLIICPVDLLFKSDESLVLRFPEKAFSYSKRRAVRHTCEGVSAEIVQGGLIMRGVLEDINPNDLRVSADIPEDINDSNSLFLKLSQDNHTYFMGECKILRSDRDTSNIILQPLHNNRPVLKTSKFPNERVRIMPQPVIQFIHPLCGLAVQNKIEDICTNGFSVIVPDKDSLLIPGMIVPQISLQMPGMINSLQCTAQVVYRHRQSKDLLRYGFYILDMSLNDQRRLFDAVSKVVDPHVNMTGAVNMDSLWELFFDSGFIYPDKYGILSSFADNIKETYRKLYGEGQDIFTHITYQDQGMIYAHMSMVKAYESSWIIHHLAARPLRGMRTGLKTLNHFVNYIDCVFRLPVSSKKMLYNFCYYRPENKFSDYYFGGIFRTLKKRESCSMDLYGYMNMAVQADASLPEGWQTDVFSPDDLSGLRKFYEKMGGGLMLDAFALKNRAAEYEGQVSGTIMDMYRKIGLKRSCRVFSLKDRGELKAVLIADHSDLGVNMSELLNSVKIIVTDYELPWTVLKSALSIVGKEYGTDSIMILVYPYDYLKHQGVDCKKTYNFWVISANIDAGEKDVVKEYVRLAKRKYIKERFVKELSGYRLDRLLSRGKKINKQTQ